MIEFRGELSDECKNYMLKKEFIIGLYASLIIIFIFSTPIIIAAIYFNNFMILMLLIGTILCGVLAPLNNKKNINSRVPTTVFIKDEKIEAEGKDFYHYRKIEDVKKIIDMDEFYHIIFYLGHKSLGFICQKDLIVQGTIEEFEQLFEGKIIKK